MIFYKKIKKLAMATFLAMACIYIIINLAFLMRLPQEIRLTEFAYHNLNISLPLRATFTNHTADTLKINNTPVYRTTSFNMRRPVTIKTQETGQAQLTIGAFGLPLRRVMLDVVPDVKLVPMGTAIGVQINTDGVMVLGTGSFLCIQGITQSPSAEALRAGDLIFKVNHQPIANKEDLSRIVSASTGDVTLHLTRDNKTVEATLTPAIAITDNVRRIGAWVRDSTKGIGTLTYYNPSSGNFGALGHGIMDVDTKKLMTVKSGVIMPSTVTNVKRGLRGTPGELEGTVDTTRTLGQITTNSPKGIYGQLCSQVKTGTPIPIGLRSQIKEGPATILTTVCDAGTREFEINIENVNRFTADATKGMVIRMTDPELLAITGGIVQGMSGSPIIQNGRLIGAITHVFVQDPTKGYGIFIESMLGISS